MPLKDWKALLSKFQVRGIITPVQDNALSEFEKAIQFKFPRSYRDYCKIFGGGFLIRPYLYEMSVPGAKTERFNLANRYKHYITEDESLADTSEVLKKNSEQLKRSWMFALDLHLSVFFWDPFEVIDRKNNEYAIYVIYEDFQVERVAGSFWDFVNDVCIKHGPPAYSKDYKPKLTFDPFE